MTDPRRRPAISVIVPARNEATTIKRAIAPLLADPLGAGVEALIAVAPSTDGTRDVVLGLAALDPRIRLVDNPAGTTPEGLNAALRASRGGVIIRMDGHAEPAPGYVSACIEVLRSTGAWNVGGQMRKTGLTTTAKAATAATSSPFGIGGGRRFHLVTERQEIDTVWLGCWPRWVFERLGLFDPEMIQNQDDEFNQRIADAGGRIVFDPSISAAYISRSTWRGLLRQYFRYGLFKVRGFQKRPRLLRPRHLAPAALVAAAVVSLLAAIVTPVGLLVFAAGALAWFVAAVVSARRVAAAHDAPLGDVVIAFACLHGAYGVGTWAGLVRFAHRWFYRRAGSIPVLDVATADAPSRAGARA